MFAGYIHHILYDYGPGAARAYNIVTDGVERGVKEEQKSDTSNGRINKKIILIQKKTMY